MKKNTKHPADIIVDVMNRLYFHRLTTTSGGNLSIMDDDGNMWISPSGVDKGNLTRADIMCVHPDGSIDGKHKPSSEYPFHLAILRSRPDLRAVLHAHPPTLVAYSLMRKIPKLDIYPGLSDFFGEMGIAKYALPGSEKLGDSIASEFRKGYNTVVLENHGVVIGAESLDRAFAMFEAMDFAARTGIASSMLKRPQITRTSHAKRKIDIADDIEITRTEVNKDDPLYKEEICKREEMCKLCKRSYEHEIFSMINGAYAARLSDGGMLITPNDEDLASLSPDDIVYVKNNHCEKGKYPSPYAEFAEQVFALHPDVEAMTFSFPPYTMAFASTDATFDSRLIPESYICLKNVFDIPLERFESDPSSVAKALNMKDPIAIVKNECAIVCGNSLLNAYDRMEVMEYGAESICKTASYGCDIVKISDDEIKEIEVAFNL